MNNHQRLCCAEKVFKFKPSLWPPLAHFKFLPPNWRILWFRRQNGHPNSPAQPSPWKPDPSASWIQFEVQLDSIQFNSIGFDGSDDRSPESFDFPSSRPVLTALGGPNWPETSAIPFEISEIKFMRPHTGTCFAFSFVASDYHLSWTYLRLLANCCPVQVEDCERGAPVLDWLNWLHERLLGSAPLLGHHQAPHAHAVLVDLDQVLVLQQLRRLGADVAQIVGHVERRRPDRPERHLGALLVQAEPEVPDHQLVGVEPVAGSWRWFLFEFVWNKN